MAASSQEGSSQEGSNWGDLSKLEQKQDRGSLRFIGVPMDLGAGRRGVDMGPSAIRGAHFSERASLLGYKVEDHGDIHIPTPECRTEGDAAAKYLDEIARACNELREVVLTALEASVIPVVAGGDHSIAIGTVAGVAEYYRQRHEKIGLLWVDAHADMNTPESSPSGNIHGMPLAACLGMGPKALVSLAGFSPKVDRDNVVLLGIRNLDEIEKEIVRRSGIHAYTMRDLDERGMASVMHEAMEHLCRGTAGFHVSFDLDAVDPFVAPGVGTPVRGGLSYREAHLIMEIVADSAKACSFEVTEINPILDAQNATAEIAVQLLMSGLGKSIL